MNFIWWLSLAFSLNITRTPNSLWHWPYAQWLYIYTVFLCDCVFKFAFDFVSYWLMIRNDLIEVILGIPSKINIAIFTAMASPAPTRSKGHRTYALLTKREVTLDIGHVFLCGPRTKQRKQRYILNKQVQFKWQNKGLYTIFRELKLFCLWSYLLCSRLADVGSNVSLVWIFCVRSSNVHKFGRKPVLAS